MILTLLIFKVEVINVNSWWETDIDGISKRFKTKNYLDLHLCNSFNGTKEDIERVGISRQYYCSKEKDYTIGGAFNAPNFRYIQINLLK